VIAKITGTPYSQIKDLNPAVLRWVTPPGVKNFTLYLPKGKKEQFKEGYAKIPDKDKRSWVRHKIRNGETLSTIARKYHTSTRILKSINKVRGSMIRAGRYLLIPVPQNKAHYYSYIAKSSSKSKKRSSAKIVKNVAGHKKVVYEVKPGDTLGEIAETYSTRASKIRAWNGLRYGQFIKPKQKLVIWVPKNREDLKKQFSSGKKKQLKKGTYYTVKRGDTLWDIAKKYNISIQELRKLNNMRGSRIRPGDRIRVSKN
jgi:membrane-bound lytic murein transglycosylase D